MFEFTPGAPAADLHPGDTLEIVTAIRRGDVVGFERVGPTEVHLAAVAPDARAGHAGPLFRVDRGADGQLVFAPVESD